MERCQILLTNDDGIYSPGLWAAAAVLSELGYVTVAAPRDQASSTGRSMPRTSDGRIERTTLSINGQDWPVHSIGGTPAQTVLHALLEIMPEKPHLVVSGINYGENVGSGVTISGTVGAAMEAASHGIPSLAVSLQILGSDYLTYADLDFSSAAFFTRLFAKSLLEKPLPPDVDLLKIDVPNDATQQTPWKVTRQSRHRYYMPLARREGGWDQPYYIDAAPDVTQGEVEPGSDVYAVLYDRVVSVTPLSLDMTSRVDFNSLEQHLGE